MQFWYLTVVCDGRATLTAIQAESIADAHTQAYGVFGDLLGSKTAWAMSDKFRENGLVSTWELENKSGSWIKASLIKG